MFFDFSSAFNTIQPHLLCDKLIMYKMPPSIIAWILDYLTDRPQRVRLGPETLSETITTFTGAPQGTVLSPFLFSIYTSDCRPTHPNCTTDKYADDSVLTGLITDDNSTDNYLSEINTFVNWCDSNFLILNVDKTKEMVIDFRKNKSTIPHITINNKIVERVDTFKYLGVVIDKELKWKQNTDNIIKKLTPRMYCLRKLKSFEVNNKLLQMFYTSMITSVITFGITSWGGNISKQDKDRLDKIIKRASGVVGNKQDDFETLLKQRDITKTTQITFDLTHPLHDNFETRLIDRSGRYRVPIARTGRYKKSFIPRAISNINASYLRNNP